MPKPPTKKPAANKPAANKPAANKPAAETGSHELARATNTPAALHKSKATRANARANAKDAKAIVKAATKISEADRRRAEALLAKIERRKESINEDFYDIGEALREILKKKLYVALGYGSFDEMLAGRTIMGRTQAYNLIALVTELPRETALAVGPEKAMLAVRYAEATPEVDTAASVLEKGTIPSGKTVADASTRELREASKQARAKTKAKKKSPEEAAAERGAREVQAALRKQGAKGATASAMRRAGEDWLRIEMPAAAAKALLR